MPLFVETWANSLLLYRVATSTSALSQEENITDVERVSPHLMQASNQSSTVCFEYRSIKQRVCLNNPASEQAVHFCTIHGQNFWHICMICFGVCEKLVYLLEISKIFL